MTGDNTELQRQREWLLSRYGVVPSEADHATLLRMIEDYLNEGLETQVEPFLETDREFSGIREYHRSSVLLQSILSVQIRCCQLLDLLPLHEHLHKL